ncbi:hypothetical protein ACN38_g9139 [Penicillium nordicum]|uniref:Uncharacterized protein n=1 Tax=Penicillium nordicum TaxID=229535 RepID=A0A0N0RY54_9EURO|nr:hypothetical protein ACN38_g9139 [Penicillium nordicum]
MICWMGVALEVQFTVRHTRPKEGELRNLLGQIEDYMDVMNLKYGVLTTYEETLFLRQTLVGGVWTLELSPVKRFLILIPVLILSL